jgi:hypothetical protein
MSFKYTPNTLKKLELLLDEANYVIRYEKGNFTSGYCILEERKVVVVNKFLNIEGRINSLIEMIPHLKIEETDLSDEMKKVWKNLKNDTLFAADASVQSQMDI